MEFYPWTDAYGPVAALAKLLKDCGADHSNIKITLDETMRSDFALLVIDAQPSSARCFLADTLSFLHG